MPSPIYIYRVSCNILRLLDVLLGLDLMLYGYDLKGFLRIMILVSQSRRQGVGARDTAGDPSPGQALIKIYQAFNLIWSHSSLLFFSFFITIEIRYIRNATFDILTVFMGHPVFDVCIHYTGLFCIEISKHFFTMVNLTMP